MADQPSIIPSAWAANNSTTETIPATTTESGKASWDQGFPVETSLPLSEGGIPPKYGDFNGVLNVLSQFCLFAQAGGQFTWSSTLSYSVGSIVVGSDGSIYRAVQATTNVNPVGDTSGKWERIVSQSDITALEADIQTAMTNAANAVSNASAAQSAVTTLDANVVKLSGNQTVGGVKTFSDWMKAKGFYQSVANGSVTVAGGAGIGANDGAKLTLYGKGEATDPGEFKLLAGNATAYKVLNGSPDGTLTWDSKDIITNGGNQTVGGEKTFSSPIVITDNIGLRKANNSGEMWITAGTSTNAAYGARLGLWGADHATASDKGAFQLQAGNANGYTRLVGKPDGTLTWGSSNVITSAGGTMTGIVTFNNQTNARSIIPNVSNSYTLGVSGTRWKEIWCNQSSINTSSDERIKQQIANIPDAVLDAWGDVDWIQFKYNDSVEEKGTDKARLHNGLIAQSVDGAFKAHGLEASKYGLFLYDQWDAEPEQKDENGNVTIPAKEAGDAYGLRYTEALCMEAAYQRRRADRAETRISALEQRLNEMEAVLASLMSPVEVEAEDYPYVAQEQDAEHEQEGGDEIPA